MTRTERQQEAVKKWIGNKGKGTIVACTGFGKTRMAIMSLKTVLKKYPDIRVLVVVPTDTLKKQWISVLNEQGIVFNVEVQIINTVIKHSWTCDFLIIDECHRLGADQFSQVFDKVNYKLILGLTATFERLDGKHIIIKKYCPVIDEINTFECIANGWISEYKEYQVLIDVDDIKEYKEFNKEWTEHFEFFQFDFKLAMNMCGPEGWKAKLAYRDEIYKGNDEERKKRILQEINYHAIGFVRTMQKRKAFINNHPKKIEIAKHIMDMRPNVKIITFSNNVKMAESLDGGEYVYTGKTSKVKGRAMIEDFLNGNIKHLHSCKKLDEGFDCPDVSVGIILGTDSSEIKARQRRGRTIRKFENKQAEVFYLIIRDTVEEKWLKNSHKSDTNYITIDEEGLEQVLRGEQPKQVTQKQRELVFRW